MEITDLNISDGSVESLISTVGQLIVKLNDWQENVWEIHFSDVVAFENISVEGEDLSEIIISNSDEFLERILERVDESLDTYSCVSFHSAWNDVPLLKVISNSWVVKSIKSYACDSGNSSSTSC